MAKSTPAVTTIDIPGLDARKLLRGQQQMVFVPGAEAYTSFKTGPAVISDGTNTVEAEIKSRYIGSLFNLVRDYGRESIYTAGQIFDAGALFDFLEANGSPIDPRTVYTVLAVVIPQQAALA